ncbi:MAG TPA: HEPN domain-containing protein [Dehalococcoidia bacterium]|nr:HEPN domain-containing protein [Dehalococcoidia bacterium]
MTSSNITQASPWTVLEAFRRSLRQTYGERLKALVLFGSLARGEWTPESDIDVAVLLDDACDAKKERESIRALARAVCPEWEALLLQPIVMREEDFRRGHAPLFFNIRREGWWIMPEDEPSAVQELLGKSRKWLTDAQRLLEIESPDSAVSRAYYAMFDAAQAALLSRGITRSRHKGVHSAFGYYFVREGLFPPDLHLALEEAYDKRITADYSPQSVPPEEAGALLKDAEAFLRAVETLVEEGTR